MENKVLDIIIEFVKAEKFQKGKRNDKRISSVDSDGTRYEIHSCSYLLGQIIRCYQIPKSNYHISVAANDLWKSLTSESIDRYFYNENIKCDRADHIQVLKFKGNENNGTLVTIEQNAKLKYNDVFHNEHTVTISTVVKKLLEEKDLTYENVSAILNQMHICRVTKVEDRKIERKSARSFDFHDVLTQLYSPAGIEIWNEHID
jgi:hypothetical protein